MLICTECYNIFPEPRHYVETHGLERPPYEEWFGCPECGGSYAKAHRCGECGEWITGEYVKLKSGERFCETCYILYEIGEEE